MHDNKLIMILTTTNTIEDFKIIDYKGIVSGIAVDAQKIEFSFSMNMQKHYIAFAEGVSEVKEAALKELQMNAEKLNANAVVGIKVDMEFSTSSYVVVSVSGTAVNVVKR